MHTARPDRLRSVDRALFDPSHERDEARCRQTKSGPQRRSSRAEERGQ